MYRVLVIRLGSALEPTLREIEREAERRGPATSICRFFDAPAAALGNLTNPVQVLREKLEADLRSALSALLRFDGGASEVRLDVFVVANLGEPMVAAAVDVVVEMGERIVAEEFATIFPSHRRGKERRYRFLPIVLLPASGDGELSRPRTAESLGELAELLEARRERTAKRDFPVDRIFVLDALTSRGILPLEALLDSARGFLRLMMFGGVRRHPDVVQMLETPSRDLFATFGVACCESDGDRLRDRLEQELVRRVTRALAEPTSCTLPSANELLPAAALEDAETHLRVQGELEALPVRTLQVEGFAAARPLADIYRELDDRLKKWEELAGSNGEVVPVSRPTSGAATRNAALAGGGLSFGGLVFAVAHFGLLVPIATAAAAGGIFGAVAAGTLLAAFGGAGAPETEVVSGGSGGEPAGVAPDANSSRRASLMSTVATQRTRLEGFVGHLDKVASSIAVPEALAGDDASTPPSVFRLTMVTEPVHAAMFARRVRSAEEHEIAESFLRSQGSWEELLDGAARIDVAALDAYAAEAFAPLLDGPLFDRRDLRELALPAIRKFLQTWNAGLPALLEGETRLQFDDDGFRTPFRSTLFRSSHWAALFEQLDQIPTGSVLDVGLELEDIFLMTAVTDIHRDAVAPLQTKENS